MPASLRQESLRQPRADALSRSRRRIRASGKSHSLTVFRCRGVRDPLEGILDVRLYAFPAPKGGSTRLDP